MKALITGGSGFVGGYLRRELENNGYEVVSLDRIETNGSIKIDLLDANETARFIKEIMPDHIYHLAGQANVPRSWEDPHETFDVNVGAAINLLDAVRYTDPSIKVLVVGSSDEYGNLKELGKDVSETTPANPNNPYAISKLAQEQIALAYAKAYKLNICATRSFNHIGPGQRQGFMVPDFASGIASVEAGKSRSIKVGNLESQRDFTFVGDVVEAYRLILEKGHSGEVYNVGSGDTLRASDILEKLISYAHVDIQVESDPSRMRPSDTPIICCNHAKLTNDTGWLPKTPIDSVLVDVLNEWRNK